MGTVAREGLDRLAGARGAEGDAAVAGHQGASDTVDDRCLVAVVVEGVAPYVRVLVVWRGQRCGIGGGQKRRGRREV